MASKPCKLTSVILFILLGSISLIISCVIEGEPEPYERREPLSGHLRPLSARIIYKGFDAALLPNQTINIGFSLQKKENLEYEILDYEARYKLAVPDKNLKKGAWKIKWKNDKINRPSTNLANINVWMEPKDADILEVIPALLYTENRPKIFKGYQFRFRKSGDKTRVNFKIKNSQNKLIYERKNLMATKDYFKLPWKGNDLKGYKATKGMYRLIIVATFDDTYSTQYEYQFYHPEF